MIIIKEPYTHPIHTHARTRKKCHSSVWMDKTYYANFTSRHCGQLFFFLYEQHSTLSSKLNCFFFFISRKHCHTCKHHTRTQIRPNAPCTVYFLVFAFAESRISKVDQEKKLLYLFTNKTHMHTKSPQSTSNFIMNCCCFTQVAHDTSTLPTPLMLQHLLFCLAQQLSTSSEWHAATVGACTR